MSVTISSPIFLQFFVPGTNQPLVGGKLFTYIGGSSTKQPTWTDYTQGTQNANPIILDANGVCSVWLDPTLTYKFVLSPSNDTDPPTSPYKTQDGIQGVLTLGTLTQNLLGMLLYPITYNESSLLITPVNYFYPPGIVDRYGNNTTPGITDMSVAIIAAVTVASYPGGSGAGGHVKVHFLGAKYLITQNNVFLPPTSFSDGYIVEGEGWDSTQLILSPSGANLFFYENVNDNTQKSAFVVFKDLMFTSNEATPQHSYFGLVQEDQGFKFHRCWFNNLYGILYASAGSASNASEHKFHGCKITGCYGDLFQIANPNSIDWEFYGCDVESCYGNYFNIISGGGGAIKIYGGSWIMLSLGAADTYFLKINGPGIGGNNGLLSFNGMKFELHGPSSGTGTSKLVQVQNAGYSVKAVFNDCYFNTYPGSIARDLVSIYGSARVEFHHCNNLTGNTDTYTINSDQNSLDYLPYGDPGSVLFDDCWTYADLSTSIVLNAVTPMGYASARGCYCPGATAVTSGGTPSTDISRYAVDFDLNVFNAVGAAQNFPGLKTSVIKPSIANWPDSAATYNYTLNLPNNAQLVRIIVYRPGGATGVAYTLQIGHSGNNTYYGSVITADSATAQTFTWDKTATPDSWVNTGTSAPGNQILISASTTATAVQAGIGGFAIAQYY